MQCLYVVWTITKCPLMSLSDNQSKVCDCSYYLLAFKEGRLSFS